ncbi:hypothetical protein GYMLUDRAFT_648642 [Collybiopsis luxurians FD-317 M1]|nr:hypothetical protein GYMLUDRAFT_648642 [Collybiopsis luxurians FD-317 M1]
MLCFACLFCYSCGYRDRQSHSLPRLQSSQVLSFHLRTPSTSSYPYSFDFPESPPSFLNLASFYTHIPIPRISSRIPISCISWTCLLHTIYIHIHTSRILYILTHTYMYIHVR